MQNRPGLEIANDLLKQADHFYTWGSCPPQISDDARSLILVICDGFCMSKLISKCKEGEGKKILKENPIFNWDKFFPIL